MTIKMTACSPDLPKNYVLTIQHAEKHDIDFLGECIVDMANAAGIGCFAYDLDEVFANLLLYGYYDLENCDGAITIIAIDDED